MKKWLAGILLILIFITLAIYLFIPSRIMLSQTRRINCTASGAYRCLSNKNNWIKWWKGSGFTTDTNSTDHVFRHRGYAYNIIKTLYNYEEIDITSSSGTTTTSMLIVPEKNDSILILWSGTLTTGYNPIKRWRLYRLSKDIENNMKVILDQLQSFLSKKENVYNISVEQQKVKDTVLVASKHTYANYPSINDIYGLINTLKVYIKKNGTQETGFPMLHVFQTGNNIYDMMVAIPVNKILPGNGRDISFKRMIPGNILVAEVQGGPLTIQEASDQLENYVHDYHFESPAIPFQSLITNRSNEPDTSKWVTKLYYPVF